MSPEATLALAATALLAAYLVAARMGSWLAKIVAFTTVGVAFGPRLVGLVDPQRHGALEAIAAVGLTFVAVALGARLAERDVGRPAALARPIAITVGVGAVIAAALVLTGVSVNASIALAAVGATATSAPVGYGSGLAALARPNEWRGDVRTATALVILLATLPFVAPSPANGTALPAIADVLLLSIALGVPAGWLLGKLSDHEDESIRWTTILATVLMLALIARFFGGWGGVAGLVAGALAVRRSDGPQIADLIRPFEDLVLLGMFVVLGAATHQAEALPTIAATAVLLAARTVAEWLAVRGEAEHPVQAVARDAVSPVGTAMAAVAVIALTQHGAVTAAGTVGAAALAVRLLSEVAHLLSDHQPVGASASRRPASPET